MKQLDASKMKTYVPSDAEVAKKDWIVLDANEQVLGRLAVQIADILRGKNKPTYTPHLDMGDNVIVINANTVKVTGNKEQGKHYATYTGHMGGHYTETTKEIREKDAARLISHAVKGMLPANRLGRAIFRKLHVYNGAEHPHAAQQPTKIN